MKLNKSCIRKVLLYIEEHCVFETNQYGDKVMHEVSFNTLTQAKELSKYSEDDIRYTIAKLIEGRYICGLILPKNSGFNFEIANINEISLSGHELLDNIRPEPVWKETKNILQKVGDFSLGIMSQVAGQIMAEYTKSMMNIH